MRLIVGLTVLLGGLLLGAAVAQPPPLPVVSNAVLERFPIARDGCPLIVPVTIRGKDYPFLLDTGADVVVCDTSLRPLLGAPLGKVKCTTAGDKTNLEVFAPPEAFLGKLQVSKDEAVPAFDFRKIREALGQDVRGILGMNFLRDYVVTLDFDHEAVSLRRQVGDTSTLGQAIPMSLRGGVPSVFLDFQVIHKLNPFLLDTGAITTDSGLLNGDLFRALAKAGKLGDAWPGGCGVTASGKKDLRITALVREVSVGPFHHRNLLFSGAAERNVLGLNYLSRSMVTFDFPSSTLYLQPGVRFNAPLDQPNRSGLGLLRVEGATVITGVEKNSPAEQAGIKVKDILLSVADLPADRGSLHPVHNLLRCEGGTVAVKYRRGKEEREVSLRLAGWPAALNAPDVEVALEKAP
jgi:hypothetical protein